MVKACGFTLSPGFLMAPMLSGSFSAENYSGYADFGIFFVFRRQGMALRCTSRVSFSECTAHYNPS
jgi:hypothetical protein